MKQKNSCSECHRTATHAVLVPWTPIPTSAKGADWAPFCVPCLPTAEDWETKRTEK